MRTKNRRMLCILLAIFVFWSGMCFDYVKADSFFERMGFLSSDAALRVYDRTVHSSDDAVISAAVELEERQICTAEMLGVRHAATTESAAGRLMGQRREIRQTPGLLSFPVFSLQPGKYSAGLDTIQTYHQYQDGRVVHYIQKSDGKKRI